MAYKPTIAIDFDGVIHRYSQGWQQGQIYDPPVPGFFEWAQEAQKHFNLVIHSSRASALFGIDQIRSWLNRHLSEWQGEPLRLDIQPEKPPAWITIDDRCIRFDGNWSARELQPDALLAFKPWGGRQ